ncbi:MAG TPA: universal stress protein [Candidatus Limnocylindrales bacterium]|nr:universal stress protein [Candidatus Limnocylindrales bacterium]
MTEKLNARYQNILVPIDGSGWSQRAIPHAVDLARLHDAQLTLLHVFVPPAPEFVPELALAGQQEQFGRLRDQAKEHVDSLVTELQGEGVRVRGVVLEGFDVAGLISDYARQEKVDLIVMSTHGRSGIARLIFGSVAKGVIDHCKVPTLLIHPDKQDPPPQN